MKKQLILIALFCGLASQGFAQSKSVDALFQKHKSNPEFFHLDLGGSFMNLAKGLNIQLNDDGADILSNSIDRIKMFKLPTSAAASEFKALAKSLERENFELLMEAGQKSNAVQLYSKGSKQIKDVVVLVSGEKGDYMVFELLGDFNSKSLAALSKSF
ncbi:DUF4252 domain-containing protein [Mongoliitalea lutea]|uniref:DUF4252 domain-containing protein n=1 Tax=Mongoliitalea lutea TaxID=849756 RepID=A0A8J3CYK7_9BACT|nr:DUF4252 domain-containing protein [Mongoliitalea lutea]GHB39219.1 hypothetical protein GCM10008106_20540 [Mongoliitalea lutea]